MQNPKKKGKVGVLVAAILVLAVAGMAVWGGQSDWFQGALRKVMPKTNVTKEVQKIDATKNVVQDIVDDPVLTVLPDLAPVTKAPLSAVSGAQDSVVYTFKVTRDGGLEKGAKLGFKADALTFDATNLDLRLWESTGGIKTEVGFLSSDFSLPSDFSYKIGAEYIVTADLPASFAGKLLTVSLFSEGVLLAGSEKTLEVLAATN